MSPVVEKLGTAAADTSVQTGAGDALDEAAMLRSLILDMGRAIRALDEDNEHLEFWTQDGDYVLDARF